MIKPGMLCYLVNLSKYPQCVGRVVTVVRQYPIPRSWVIEASWCASFFEDLRGFAPRGVVWADEFYLRPIHDPDADLTETHDEELTA